MDLLITFYSVLLTVFLYFEGISSFDAVQSVTPTLPVLGDGGFTLQCTFTRSDLEALQGVKLQKKPTGDLIFGDFVTIPPPYLPNNPISFSDPSVEARTVVTRPDISLSTSASVTFNKTECGDIAEYKWIVSYYSDGDTDLEKISNVTAKVYGTLEGSSGYGITSITPGYDVAEDTNVTVTCKADVGAEPQGQLEWEYYIEGSPTAYPISDKAIKGPLETVRTCSHSQESTLTLPMTENLNKISIRCTLLQDNVVIQHNQTNRFNVAYSARKTTIASVPFYSEYSEGEEKLMLTCSSMANPLPSYTWLLPNGTEVAGPTYTLQNLQINDTGTYTCTAKNGVPDENSTDTKVLQLKVVEKTTTTATTTPSTPAATSSPTSPKTGGSGGSDDGGMSDTTIIIIVVCVVVGVGIVIAIIVVVICKKRNKKPEIEEPPEKPRNNQDLTYYGNRPGLTTSNEHLKNSGNNLNTSFNSFDSTDSKPRNDDGLMYVDLQFDDKPRSRRPIQMYDNGGSNTQYADIAMPRV